MAKLQYAIPPYTISKRYMRGYYLGEQPHGSVPAEEEPPAIPVLRKLSSHRCLGPRDPYLYWLENYGVKVMDFNRTLHRHIWHAWKNDLTAENRANWSAAAATVLIANYRDVLKIPKGFQLFTWHHFFKSCDTWPTSFPFQGALPTLEKDPPSPYTLPNAPHITGLSSSNHDGFRVNLDNWPADGKQLCLTSIQRLSTPGGKFTRLHKYTGSPASGIGTAGTGYLDVHPLYPWPDPQTGTTFRFGLRYHAHAGDPVTGPASPTVAVDAGDGPVVWQNPQNVCDYNATYAKADIQYHLGQTHTNELHASGFNWDPPIPDAAQITGIEAEVMAQCLDYYHRIFDLTVRLMKQGVPVGDNKAYATWPLDKIFPWPYFYYYAPDTLWGETWTGADLNHPGFGLAVAGRTNQTYAYARAMITHIRVTAWWTTFVTIPSNPTYYDWTRPA